MPDIPGDGAGSLTGTPTMPFKANADRHHLVVVSRFPARFDDVQEQRRRFQAGAGA
jgi:hypothetical protein